MEAEKIRAIRRYLKQNGVEYYDVQAELIDHFASAVEEAEKEKEGIAFKEALIRAHRAFGGREGFRKYMEAAQKRVEKKTMVLIGQTLLRYVSWPYLLLSIGLYLIWYLAIPYWTFISDYLVLGFIFGFLMVGLLNTWRVRKLDFYLPRRANVAMGTLFFFSYYLLLYPYLFLRQEGYIYGWWDALVFTLISLVTVACLQLPKLTMAETEKLYPQAT